MIPWLSGTAVLAGAENDFDNLELYACDGQFFWGVELESLGSRVWLDIVAVDDYDLKYHGSADARKSHLVADVAKGMLALASEPLVEEDVDVDLWSYRYYGELRYAVNLFALQTEKLASWSGRYMVNPDSICWESGIILSRFRYLDGLELVYWSQQVRWEKRTLSSLGRFLPYQMCCFYNIRETARDCRLARIRPDVAFLDVYNGFRFEQ